ncbi:hypothetical protein Q0N07_14560, partial [Staphylococcus aureus]|nr:hypothetical protein [Staphylococcus aureus]
NVFNILFISIYIFLFLFLIFSNDGKRIYRVIVVFSFIYNQEDCYSYRINHVNLIEVI